MVTTANVISYLISAVAVLITIFALVRSTTKEDSTALTTVLVKLENINSIVSETQRDLKSIREDVRSIENRVTRLETLMGDGNGKQH